MTDWLQHFFFGPVGAWAQAILTVIGLVALLLLGLRWLFHWLNR